MTKFIYFEIAKVVYSDNTIEDRMFSTNSFRIDIK